MLFLLVLVVGWVFISVKDKKGGGRMEEDVVKKWLCLADEEWNEPKFEWGNKAVYSISTG